MSYIKGQNLRLLVGAAGSEKCIALAETCTLSINSQISDHSTKDTTGNFIENKVDGLSWEVTAESLVTDNWIHNGNITCTEQSGDLPIYAYPETFHLCAGDTVTAAAAYGGVTLYLFDANGIIAQETDDTLTYTATEDIDVALAASTNTVQILLKVKDNSSHSIQALFDYMENNTAITVNLSTTSGSKNRTLNLTLLFGSAIISSLSVNSPNRQDSTLSITLTGVSELESQFE